MADGNPLIIGQINDSVAETALIKGLGGGESSAGLRVNNNQDGFVAAVAGSSPNNPGVQGVSKTDRGVVGYGTPGLQGVGVAGSHGVQGYSTGESGVGVYGESQTGTGVWGYCGDWAGVTGSGYLGVYGSGLRVGVSAFANNGVGLVAAGRTAAMFVGRVLVLNDLEVDQDLVVYGNKSAAVPHPDGTHRKLYCVESPESWFEDFGSAEIVDGVARIKLDPDFAALVDTSDYHVFLTSNGPNQLYVHERTAEGFEVRTTSSHERPERSSLSYRVVARRKDASGSRLERVTKLDRPEAPPTPEPAQVPKPDFDALERVAEYLLGS